MPAAAVIPASVASIKVVAVERFAVECLISYDHQYIRILATALVSLLTLAYALRSRYGTELESVDIVKSGHRE